MADWPPVNTDKANRTKEKVYLTLVDMFVDVVEPDIIQMVLQNRNWDLDSALEDIMVLSNTPQSGRPTNNSGVKLPSHFEPNKSLNQHEMISKDAKSTYLNKESGNFNIFKLNSAVGTSENFQHSKFPSKSVATCLEKKNISKSTKHRQGNIITSSTTMELKNSKWPLVPFLDQYNYVKAIPVTYDRAVILIRDNVKLMVILRGPPGSGKSYLARKLLKEAGVDDGLHKKYVFSTDDYFVRNGVYVFNPDLLSEAHSWNQRNVASAAREQNSPIIVDNTNTQAWEMKVYVEIAISFGYDLEILEPTNWWVRKESELAKRNVHGVPKAKIRSMIDRYEKNITPQLLFQQFNLHYSLSNTPPQPARNSKWRDEYGSQKNNRPKKKKERAYPKNATQSTLLKPLSCESNAADILKSNLYPTKNDNTDVEESQYSKKDCEMFQSNALFDFDKTFNNTSISCDNSNLIPTTELFTMKTQPFPEKLKEYTFPTHATLKREDMKEFSLIDKLVLPSDNQDSDQKYSFDFLAESNKLLDAIKIVDIPKQQSMLPVSYTDISTSHPHKSQPDNLLDNGLVCKENETIMPSNEMDSNLSFGFHNCNDSVNKKESIVASSAPLQEIVESIVDKVFTIKEKHCSHNSCINEHDILWDYVLVDDSNSYIYKRLHVNPLPSKSTKISTPSISIDDSKITNNELTFCFKEGKDNNSSISIGASNETKNDSVSEQNNVVFTDSFLNDEKKSIMQLPCPSLKSSQPEYIGSCCNRLTSDCIESLKKKQATNPIAFNEPKENTVKNESKANNSVNILEMMSDILNSVAPKCTSSKENELLKPQEVNIMPSNELSEWNIGRINSDSNENNSIYKNKIDSWNIGDLVMNSSGSIKSDLNQPKPPRDLSRSKMSRNFTSPMKTQEQFPSDILINWEPVSNPLDFWGTPDTKATSSSDKIDSSILPQRHRIGSTNVHVSTNTNYLDFSLVNEDNPVGVKILIGKCRNINKDGYCNIKAGVPGTLFLDKSTMTLGSFESQPNNLDINQISNLFPEIPEKYILDVIEKCQGDIDWAVDLLLDSEHSIYSLENKECSYDDQLNGDKVKDQFTIVDLKDTKCDENFPRREPKRLTDVQELTDLKRKIEESIVFGKDHYSDKILKVLKKKHPDYLLLVEGNSMKQDRITNNDIDVSQKDYCNNNSEDEVEDLDIDENTIESSNSSGYDVEKEDDTFDIIINNDLIVQLQQKFGHSNLPTSMMKMSPVVKLPVSLARQLYGYIMDSMQTELEEQQTAIESMIAQDEEIAKMLQNQLERPSPQFQEIMDMEMALAVHRADQEEWRANSNKSVAATLSKNILIDKFPHVDPKMLIEVLHAHNYSLHDTVASLSIALEGEQPYKQPTLQEPTQVKEWSADDSVLLERAASSADPLEAAQTHRDQASTYYSLRVECLNKAHEAFRSGNKPVASYYSQMAQLHKDRMSVCNSRAAACLLSAHKCGTNTLDLHFLHVTEAEIVLDMFLDEVIIKVKEKKKRHQIVFLITGRGLRSVGGVSRIKPMVQRKLQGRRILFNEVNPGMLSALIRSTLSLSCSS